MCSGVKSTLQFPALFQGRSLPNSSLHPSAGPCCISSPLVLLPTVPAHTSRCHPQSWLAQLGARQQPGHPLLLLLPSLPPKLTCPCSFLPVVGDSAAAEQNQASQFRAGFASFPSPPQGELHDSKHPSPAAAGLVPALTRQRCLQPSRAGLQGHGANGRRELVATHSLSMGEMPQGGHRGASGTYSSCSRG